MGLWGRWSQIATTGGVQLLHPALTVHFASPRAVSNALRDTACSPCARLPGLSSPRFVSLWLLLVRLLGTFAVVMRCGALFRRWARALLTAIDLVLRA